MNQYNRDQVLSVINTVVEKVGSAQHPLEQHVHEEIAGLSETIEAMRAEIMATRSQDIGSKHIPTATDELDAVVGATEQASATIMDACEHIQGSIADLPESVVKKIINDQIIKIFEACSFQDITGQRITKVVNTLTTIESKVANLLNLLGPVDGVESQPSAQGAEKEKTDDDLMNGPQMAGQAISQEDIDKLLADFD